MPRSASTTLHTRSDRSLIHAQALRKTYGEKAVVDWLDFTVRPGIVTGFLGPNGAGVDDNADDPRPGPAHRRVRHRQRKVVRRPAAPLHEVGALLEARSVHTGRSGDNHLLPLARTHGISNARVQPVVGGIPDQPDWTHMHPGELVHFEPIGDSLTGINFSQLAIGVLGVLFITGEYGTGMIRSTLAAAPKRLSVLWAR